MTIMNSVSERLKELRKGMNPEEINLSVDYEPSESERLVLFAPMYIAQEENKRLMLQIQELSSAGDPTSVSRQLKLLKQCADNTKIARIKHQQLWKELRARRLAEREVMQWQQKFKQEHDKAHEASSSSAGPHVTVVDPEGNSDNSGEGKHKLKQAAGRLKQMIVDIAPESESSKKWSEANAVWLKALRHASDSDDLIASHLKLLLGANDSAPGKKISKFGRTFVGKYAAAAHADAYEAVVDVRNFSQELATALLVAFPLLSTCENVDGIIQVAIEEAIFSRIGPDVFRIYQAAHAGETAAWDLRHVELKERGPAQFGVRKKFQWNMVEERSILEYDYEEWEAARGAENRRPDPYEPAALILRGLVKSHSPTEKLQVITRSLRTIVDIINIYCANANLDLDAYALGADDLIALFSWVVVQAEIEDLPVHYHIMADFVSDYSVLGEDGYSLATLNTVLDWLCTPTAAAAAAAASAVES